MSESLFKSRRWSYSLRTLFAVVTIVAILLGREVNRARARHTWADRIQAAERDGAILTMPLRNRKYFSNWKIWNGESYFDGEEVVLPKEWPKSDAKKFKDLFPGATVYWSETGMMEEIP